MQLQRLYNSCHSRGDYTFKDRTVNDKRRKSSYINSSFHLIMHGRRPATSRPAFVGDESSTQAGEYHCTDFEWSTVISDGEAALKRQREEHAAMQILKEQKEGNVDVPFSDEFEETNNWDLFHQTHSAAKFFKEKRYIPLAFPDLLPRNFATKDGRGFHNVREATPMNSPISSPYVEELSIHVAEIGCGCGSALIPVLKANQAVHATACDVSATAIDLFLDAAKRSGIELSRINAFAYDAKHYTTTMRTSPLHGIDADFVLMIFTLSALHPRDMPSMLREAYEALKPGGKLLFRDYGLYDMAQLRFSGSQIIDIENLVYRRLDGTLSYFFSKEKLEELASETGFTVVECEYARTLLKNRKNGLDMKRVFLHAVLQK